jgi:hypothetical protein
MKMKVLDTPISYEQIVAEREKRFEEIKEEVRKELEEEKAKKAKKKFWF